MDDGDLARLRVLAEIRAEAQAKVDAAAAQQWQIIHAATQGDYPRGMPVKLAEASQLSVQRIYQIRDGRR